MFEFNAMIERFVREELDAPQLISAGNWKTADDLTLLDVERYSYTANAVAAVNRYVGSFFWFTIGRGYDSGLGKWSANTPDQLGMFPAAALAFRNQYLQQGETVVHERRALPDLWNRRSTILAESAGFDPQRDTQNLPPDLPVQIGVDPRAFLTGPVKVSYDAEPSETEVAALEPFIQEDGEVIRGNTDQVILDTTPGLLTIDAPKMHAAAGFLARASPIQLSTARIESQNEYAAVHLISLDAVSLAESKNVLIQVATTVRPYGFETKPATIERDGNRQAALEITNLGSSPLNLEHNEVRIELANPGLKKAYVLDANGYATSEHPLEFTAGGVRFTFPKDALYLVLHDN